jgi:hypothetical protein
VLNPSKVETFLNKLPIRHRETGKNVPFIFNPNQKILNGIAQHLYDKGKPLWLILLKSRRVGGSAWADAYLTCHCVAKESAEALIVAHEYRSSKALFSIPRGLVGGLPFVVPPTTQHKVEFPHKDGLSTLQIATAGTTVSGRGLTLSALHLSEAALYPAAESFTSLINAVSYDPSTILIMESTANGKVGPGETFYQYWKAAVEGRNEFTPVFLSWLDDPGCYRHPKESKGYPADDYEKELIRIIKGRKDHTKVQIEGRIAWRRWALETKCQGISELFDQEYPIEPELAFISTGSPAFDKEERVWAKSTIRKPEFQGHITRYGNEIETAPSEDGGWFIWHRPQPGHYYYIGADAARGEELGESGQMRDIGDFAAVVIWDGNTGEQVARYSERSSPDKLAEELDKAGRYFNRAMISVELTGNLGLWVQASLRDKYLYSNLYRWRGKDDKIRDAHASRAIGWETTGRTRDLMFSAFRVGLRQQKCTIRDQGLYEQMEAATKKEGLRWEVMRGHDDVLIAAMIGWVAVEQWAPPRMLGGAKPLEDIQEQLPLKYQSDHIYALRDHINKVMNYTKNTKSGDRLQGL